MFENNNCVSFQNPDALFLKSNYEYIRENYPKAIKLLNSAPLQTIVSSRGQSLATLFYNNLSCIHFKMKKYNLGIFYARKALEENIQAMKSLPPIEKSMLMISLQGTQSLGFRLCYVEYEIGIDNC